MFETGDIQTSIFHGSNKQLEFAELCNSLYESCLIDLTKQDDLNSAKFRRRLGGLSYHIKSAAFKLLTIENPLSVDIHNGSWQSKQSRKCMALAFQDESMVAWYQKHACYGLPVPVYVADKDQQIIELDSIDKLDLGNNRIRLNKNDWVTLEETTEQANVIPKTILQKPTKPIMTAACCGHRWNYKGSTHPRRLSLRELLLSTTVSWKNFKFPI
ncbi:MAG: hypothetical protein GJ680_03745 [Alteromonadaceae bacterium]|nr:hypothetical protein [Alteromonadaceae bacterium]